MTGTNRRTTRCGPAIHGERLRENPCCRPTSRVGNCQRHPKCGPAIHGGPVCRPEPLYRARDAIAGPHPVTSTDLAAMNRGLSQKPKGVVPDIPPDPIQGSLIPDDPVLEMGLPLEPRHPRPDGTGRCRLPSPDHRTERGLVRGVVDQEKHCVDVVGHDRHLVELHSWIEGGQPTPNREHFHPCRRQSPGLLAKDLAAARDDEGDEVPAAPAVVPPPQPRRPSMRLHPLHWHPSARPPSPPERGVVRNDAIRGPG